MNKISASNFLIIKFIIGSIIISFAMYYVNLPDQELPPRFLFTEQFVTTDEQSFYNKLSIRRAEIFDKNECIGHYTLCENDLTRIGYFIPENESCSNNWIGRWTGKYGIQSRDNFLFMPLIQDYAMKELSTIYYKNIYYYNLDKYINNDLITPASLVAIMHLYGPVETLKFFHGKSDRNKYITHDLANFSKYKIEIFEPYNYSKTQANINLLLEQSCLLK